MFFPQMNGPPGFACDTYIQQLCLGLWCSSVFAENRFRNVDTVSIEVLDLQKRPINVPPCHSKPILVSTKPREKNNRKSDQQHYMKPPRHHFLFEFLMGHLIFAILIKELLEDLQGCQSKKPSFRAKVVPQSLIWADVGLHSFGSCLQNKCKVKCPYLQSLVASHRGYISSKPDFDRITQHSNPYLPVSAPAGTLPPCLSCQ